MGALPAEIVTSCAQTRRCSSRTADVLTVYGSSTTNLAAVLRVLAPASLSLDRKKQAGPAPDQLKSGRADRELVVDSKYLMDPYREMTVVLIMCQYRVLNPVTCKRC